MAAKLVECEHCGGGKNCTSSGGRSCRICLEAAGLGKRRWAAVRCSYCGGKGKIWMEEEVPEDAEDGDDPGEEQQEAGDAAEQ